MDDFEKLIDDMDQRSEHFWSVEYPKMPLEDKQKYWLKDVYGDMRSMGESTGDRYGAFSKSWYDDAKVSEPNFDNIFEWVAANLGFEFDWKEYKKRIQK